MTRRFDSGFSLIQVLIVIGLFGIMVSAITTAIVNLTQFQARLSFLERVVALRETYVSALSDNRVWRSTVQAAANTELACLRNLTTCAAYSGAAAAFSPMDLDGNLLNNYNPQVPTDGFDVQGNVCRTFDATAPDGQCVVHIDFNWRASALCTGTCLNPTAQIDITFQFAIPTNSPLAPSPNPARLNPPPLFRSGSPDIVLARNCAANQVVVGFNPDGSPVCMPANLFGGGGGGACTCSVDPCACLKSGQCECPGQCGKSCP